MKQSTVAVEIAFGEVVDKITILEIKSERIKDPYKLKNVQAELEVLNKAFERSVETTSALSSVRSELKRINELLWDIEDEIRECEHAQDFGPRFIELARSVYRTNDKRALLKRKVNELTGSDLVEEKSYSTY